MNMKPLRTLTTPFKHAGFAALSLLLSMGAHAAIFIGPHVNPANGHAYYLLQPDTWTASRVKAVALGGDLVTISDLAENTWVCN